MSSSITIDNKVRHFATYPKYKDSGIEWLGEIPEGWDVLSIKRLLDTKISDGPHETPELIDDGIPFISAEAIKNHKIDFSLKRGYISQELHEAYCKKVKPKRNDIFFVKSGATTGAIAMVETDDEFSIWSPLAVIRAEENKALPRYLFYTILSKEFQNQVMLSWSFGTQQNIGMGVIENLLLSSPPFPEQIVIASFLDRETSRIDSLIAKKQRQIELLQEKRSALISHAVTKGLDPNVKRKDSGVEWLGEIPEVWRVLRLKHSAKLVNKKIDGSSSELPYIGLENIESWTGKPVNGTEASKSEGQSNLFKAGDVLFGKLRPYLAKVFYPENDGICTGELLVLRPNEVVGDFLFYYLLAREFITIVDSSTYGAKMPRANWDFIGNLPSLIPPQKEQISIASFLDRETSRIDELINKVKESIGKLHEYRSALISAAVTGKIDVREETA